MLAVWSGVEAQKPRCGIRLFGRQLLPDGLDCFQVDHGDFLVYGSMIGVPATFSATFSATFLSRSAKDLRNNSVCNLPASACFVMRASFAAMASVIDFS